MTFVALDIVLLLIVIVCIVQATIAGFIQEFFSKAAVLLSTILAILFYRRGALLVRQYLGDGFFPEAVSFLVIFLAVYLVVKILQNIAGNLFESESLSNLDRALGFFLGIAEGALAVVVILTALRIQPWFDVTPILEGSLFVRVLEPFIPASFEALPALDVLNNT